MRVDEQQAAIRLEDRKRETVRSRIGELRSLAQAEVVSAKLTGSEEWDTFLRIAQGMLAQAEQDVRQTESRVVADWTLAPDGIQALRLQAATTLGRIQALEEIMKIPSLMVRGGHEARELIRKYAEDEESSLS